MHFLSHYSNAAEDTIGRAVTTPHSPRPCCARGWAGALGGWRNLQGCLPHALVSAWQGHEWVGKGKDECGEVQLPHMLLVLNNL